MHLNPSFLIKQHKSILITNCIIHFDNAIYGYLVPVMAPMFFPTKSIIVQLILGYSVLIASFVAKPFGVIFFSKIAQVTKEQILLCYTLLGISVGLIAIGLLPIQYPLWSVVLLVSARICIEACSAGEHAVAKMYLIKESTIKQAKKFCVLYEISSMMGILLAAVLATLFTQLSHPAQYWRFPFILSGVATLLNFVVFRLSMISVEQDLKIPPSRRSELGHTIYQQFWKERKPMMRIMVAAGFSYVTYTIPFLFMNSFVPMVTNISYSAMMNQVTILMIADVLLLGWLGKICQKYDFNNLMAVASGLVTLSIIPLFGGLRDASMFYVMVVRYWLLFLGVVFCCFLTLWSKEQVSTKTPYLTVGFATELGHGLLGKSATAICLSLFHWFNSPVAPACYIALLAFITTLIMADSSSA